MTKDILPHYNKPWKYEYKDLREQRLREIGEELHTLFQSPSVDGRYIASLLHERNTRAESYITKEHNKRINFFTNNLQPKFHSLHSFDIERTGYVNDDHKETTLFLYTHNDTPTHFGCVLTFRTEITGCTSERIQLFQVKKGRTIEELVQNIEKHGEKKESYDIAPFHYFNEYKDDNGPIIVLDRYDSGFNYVGYTERDSKEYIALKTPLLKELQRKGISLRQRDFSKNNF